MLRKASEVSLGPVIIVAWWQGFFTTLSTVGDYRGHESLVIRLLHDEERELHFWFQDLAELKRALWAYLFAGPVGSGNNSMHELGKSLLKGTAGYVDWRSSRDQAKKRCCTTAQWSYRAELWKLDKTLPTSSPRIFLNHWSWDSETARAVVRASLTGATVFSATMPRGSWGLWVPLRTWCQWRWTGSCFTRCLPTETNRGRRNDWFCKWKLSRTPGRKVEWNKLTNFLKKDISLPFKLKRRKLATRVSRRKS